MKMKIVFDIKKATRLQVQQYMTAHIERTEIPDNCNPELTHLNRDLIPHPKGVDRTQAIVDRIKATGVTVRKNSVVALQLILTATHEGMKELEHSGRLDEWVDDNMKFLCELYGNENVVAATLHLDEKTPHIHATVVPTVTGKRRSKNEKKPNKRERELEEKREQKALQKHLKSGGTHENFKRGNTKKRRYTKKDESTYRLCADDLYTSQNLYRARLKYYNDVGMKYGFEYGDDHMHDVVPFKNKKKHQTNQQYYEEIGREIPELEQKKEKLKQDISKTKSERNVEKLKTSAVNLGTNLLENIGSRIDLSGRKQRDEEIADLKNQLFEKDKDIAKLQIKHNNEVGELREEQARILTHHNSWRENVINCIPMLWEQLRIAEICRKLLSIENSTIKNILSFATLTFRKIRVANPENNKTYVAEGLRVKVAYSDKEPEKLELRLDDIEYTEWLRRKEEQRKQEIALRPKPQEIKRGIRM